MKTLRATGICALLTAVLATTAFAQHAQTRQGFWIGGGLGYGSLGLSCDAPSCGDVGREGGPSGYFNLGGTLGQSFRLGVESNAWRKSEGTATVTMANFSGAGYWYPMPAGGLFLKGGVGYSTLSVEDDIGDASDSGFGFLGGVGYDIRVGRNLSITPVANWYRGGFDGGSANVLQLAVGVTSH
jgi:Outer membrane protein beta-barrel domain